MLNYLLPSPSIRCSDKELQGICKSPVVIRVTQFNSETLDRIDRQLGEALAIGQTIVPVVIDSFGGCAYSLLGMVHALSNTKLTIATVVESKAMSSGAVLFSCGHKDHRYIGPNARLMIHDVKSSVSGKVEEIKSDAAVTEEITEEIYRILDRNCNQDPGFFRKQVHDRGHADWYISSSQAVELRLATKIHIPEIVGKVSVSYCLN